ncbi:hypothetical protein DFJ74DRAFT_762993 [Hyaloraphidium curvatum]|nr:hypothetical protein DFJ74DRAFT_762993 [Hyaloraphidium curvatum]
MPDSQGLFSFRVFVGGSSAGAGRELPEYGVGTKSEPGPGYNRHVVTAFVPSEANQRFYVRVRNEGCDFETVSARIFIDGQLQYKGILRKPGDTHHVEGRVLSATAVAPFLFSRPTFANGDDAGGGANSAPEAPLSLAKELVPTSLAAEIDGEGVFSASSIGEIRMELWKVSEKRTEYGVPSVVLGTNGFVGKADGIKPESGDAGLKAVSLKEGEKKTALLSHTTTFGKATAPLIPVPQSRVHSADLDTKPWIVHSIRYRSKDLLDAEGLTEVKPVLPVPTSSSSSGRKRAPQDRPVPSAGPDTASKRVKNEVDTGDDSEIEEIPVIKKEPELVVLDD